jgi:membrane protein implicated in regulation of membrane protease activity
MRAADLLVLLGAHDSIADAQGAIAAMKKNPSQEGKKLPAGARIDMVKRMSYLLGLLAPDAGYSRFRFIIGWVGIGLLLLVGFVLPLVWVPYLAFSTRRSTLRLAARAREYYEAGGAADAGLIVRRGGSRTSFGGGIALGRTFLLLVLPIGAAIIALLTNTSPGGGRWLVAGLIFLTVSFIASFLWLGFRWLRRTGRRFVRPPRAANARQG